MTKNPAKDPLFLIEFFSLDIDNTVIKIDV